MWGPYTKDPTILGYYIGVPYFRKLPYLYEEVKCVHLRDSSAESHARPSGSRFGVSGSFFGFRCGAQDHQGHLGTV